MRGPKVSVIKRIPHAYVTNIGNYMYVIVSARSGFTEFIFLSAGCAGGREGGA